MKRSMLLLGFLLCLSVAMAGIGCTDTDSVVEPQTNTASITDSPSLQKGGRGTIWADDELFETVGTPASFKPGSGNFDEWYNVGAAGGAFKDGVGAISVSKPGDKDWNGGRWHVNVIKEGVDPNKYPDASAVGDLDLNDFMGTDIYFECPLLPRRGNN